MRTEIQLIIRSSEGNNSNKPSNFCDNYEFHIKRFNRLLNQQIKATELKVDVDNDLYFTLTPVMINPSYLDLFEINTSLSINKIPEDFFQTSISDEPSDPIVLKADEIVKNRIKGFWDECISIYPVRKNNVLTSYGTRLYIFTCYFGEESIL